MTSTSFPFGPRISEDEISFSLWAPSADTVELALTSRILPMQPKEDGWWQVTLPWSHDPDTQPGQPYQFRINQDLLVPDPASRRQQDDVHGPSLIPTCRAYDWQVPDWRGRPWKDAVIYELHIGTFSPEGTFDGARERLPYLVDLGITAIELMPVADFPGQHSWGYDGVLQFAPDTSYGSPEDLKRLIDEAHNLGIMVMLDVVYNHFGPDGNYLYVYARDFFTDRITTPWGQAIDYARPEVRSFFVQNALYWLQEFRFDGLRLDAVQEIHDKTSEEHFLFELARTVREQLPPERHVHLVLENDANQARYLGEAYRAQWNDDYHHVVHSLLTGESGGYYQDYATQPLQQLCRILTEGFAYQGDPSPYRDGEIRGEDSSGLPAAQFVHFLQNHDQTGNRAFGERIHELADPRAVAAAHAALLLAPQPPMLYMGEEWSASTPFQFFCDFGEDLADAVRNGRRQEFAKFPEFSDPALVARIPDPNSPETCAASRLNWQEREQEPHRSKLREMQALLELRRTYIVPLLEGIWHHSQAAALPLGDQALLCVFHAAGSPSLALAVNLGDQAVDCSQALHTTSLHHAAYRMLWSSCGRESALTEEEWQTLPGYCTRAWIARS
ncbi:malto-oligosyltrehalose trehalohydrolase [Spirochaeta africana]|uniref:Malto-oligosyltrehalose trehalohydrolase n=1 Tax=Spirochaeta africana (strain ATCC 700263 / DSM 8902 / Z-7692) TaxID=889378 RepID=H9UFW9_SPIAZ|nr:malto-oligosyltrehalose trehalohydrolase [Spirochaeta africana]AFG36412.1 malto-oligosyltrehalose trehalohydrolase [Spirochaeta africana DSM 8902]